MQGDAEQSNNLTTYETNDASCSSEYVLLHLQTLRGLDVYAHLPSHTASRLRERSFVPFAKKSNESACRLQQLRCGGAAVFCNLFWEPKATAFFFQLKLGMTL
jgi:hypothetical protein